MSARVLILVVVKGETDSEVHVDIQRELIWH